MAHRADGEAARTCYPRPCAARSHRRCGRLHLGWTGDWAHRWPCGTLGPASRSSCPPQAGKRAGRSELRVCTSGDSPTLTTFSDCFDTSCHRGSQGGTRRWTCPAMRLVTDHNELYEPYVLAAARREVMAVAATSLFGQQIHTHDVIDASLLKLTPSCVRGDVRPAGPADRGSAGRVVRPCRRRQRRFPLPGRTCAGSRRPAAAAAAHRPEDRGAPQGGAAAGRRGR